MKRVKRHKTKQEVPQTSTSHNTEHEQHDLAYYIHDRVELMHQVFSVLKYKELKAMVPACIRNISLDDLQELCTEELLGISSKRLCAILDGGEPPTDTESSSPSPEPETISLDSISSDDEVLSQASKKKKHKHRRPSKSKRKKIKDKADTDKAEGDKQESTDNQSKATRAGLTVLELLELQARARAIRAQLQQEHKNKSTSQSVAPESTHSSDGEVEIKEEPAEVVEISSEDEKPRIEDLHTKISQKEAEPPPTSVTKRINNLVITVPQKPAQKIKLNRQKSNATQENKTNNEVKTPEATKQVEKTKEAPKDKQKEKIKKKKKQKTRVNREGSDNDEITLQLSDSEKMDLLEDLDRKNLDYVSSDSESSSETESTEDSQEDSRINDKNSAQVSLAPETTHNTVNGTNNVQNSEVSTNLGKEDDSNGQTGTKTLATNNSKSSNTGNNESVSPQKPSDDNEEIARIDVDAKENNDDSVLIQETTENVTTKDAESSEKLSTESSDKIEEVSTIDPTVTTNTDNFSLPNETGNEIEQDTTDANQEQTSETDNNIEHRHGNNISNNVVGNETEDKTKQSTKDMSDGELSDRESSEIEAIELKPEVVCISDEETSSKSKKKKKKKDKKSKKEKKSKKNPDFRETADQNFYKERVVTTTDNCGETKIKKLSITISNSMSQENVGSSDNPQIETDAKTGSTISDVDVDLTIDQATGLTNDDTETYKTEDSNSEAITNTSPKAAKRIDVKDKKRNTTQSESSIDDDVYEILELSDDSSCYEVGSILSKEPTTLEIEALSAKIDEIDRIEVITEEEIREYEKEQNNTAENEAIEKISWKDRYLDSKKVKRVLNTSNILNALRKKNIELKKKLEESKVAQKEEDSKKESPEEDKTMEDGTIDQYNTLESCTKYVDPVTEDEIYGSLKKDAKQLLKMYKKLLKYNDINKKKDPDKKKKKKKKERKKSVDKVQKET